MSKEGQISLSRSDLANYIAKKENCSVSSAENNVKQVLSGITDLIQEKLGSDQLVSLSLTHFGSFKVKQAPARKCRNPKTGETIDVPARKKLSFQPSKEFKTKVAESVK